MQNIGTTIEKTKIKTSNGIIIPVEVVSVFKLKSEAEICAYYEIERVIKINIIIILFINRLISSLIQF